MTAIASTVGAAFCQRCDEYKAARRARSPRLDRNGNREKRIAYFRSIGLVKAAARLEVGAA